MREIKLKIIPPPSKGSCAILDLQDNKIKGQEKRKGGNSLLCGSCGNILAEKVFFEQVKNVVLRCKCGNFNIVPRDWSIFRLIDIRENWRLPTLFLGLFFVSLGGVLGNIWNWQAGIVIGVLGTIILFSIKRKTKILSA